MVRVFHSAEGAGTEVWVGGGGWSGCTVSEVGEVVVFVAAFVVLGTCGGSSLPASAR